jgi:hypothetical protein
VIFISIGAITSVNSEAAGSRSVRVMLTSLCAIDKDNTPCAHELCASSVRTR